MATYENLRVLCEKHGLSVRNDPTKFTYLIVYIEPWTYPIRPLVCGKIDYKDLFNADRDKLENIIIEAVLNFTFSTK